MSAHLCVLHSETGAGKCRSSLTLALLECYKRCLYEGVMNRSLGWACVVSLVWAGVMLPAAAPRAQQGRLTPEEIFDFQNKQEQGGSPTKC